MLKLIASFLFASMIASILGCDEPAKPVKRPPQVKTEVLDFYADWCGPCRTNAPAIDRLEREGHKIVRINIDHDPALASKYRITSVPTYVIRINGRESFRTSSVQELRAKLKVR